MPEPKDGRGLSFDDIFVFFLPFLIYPRAQFYQTELMLSGQVN